MGSYLLKKKERKKPEKKSGRGTERDRGETRWTKKPKKNRGSEGETTWRKQRGRGKGRGTREEKVTTIV